MSEEPKSPFNNIKPAVILIKCVLLESLRRRDFYAVLILSLLFVLGIFITSLIGIENAAKANLLLNLGMSLAWFFAHIVTLFSAARQIPEDMENKTIYPLLAKPLKRREYYIGKWGAVSLSGWAAFIILFLLGWVPVPKMQAYNSSLLLQTFIMIMLSIALLAALAMLFSLIFTNGANILISGLLLVFYGHLSGFINAKLHPNLTGNVIRWIIAYIPDFSKLNLITRYTDGIDSLSILQFGGLVIYSIFFIILLLILGVTIFEKKSI